MKLRIESLNDALDERGNRTQGFNVCDESGTASWLIPSLRLRLEGGCLDLSPGDTVIGDDFASVGGSSPLLVAGFIRALTPATDSPNKTA